MQTDDQGSSWENIQGSYTLVGIDSSGALYGKTNGSSAKYYKTENLGVLWQQIPLPSNFDPETFNLNTNGQIFLTGMVGSIPTVIRIINNGTSWTALPPLPPSFNQYQPRISLIDNDGYFYATFFGYAQPYHLVKSSLSTTHGAHLQGNATTSDDADCTTIDPVAPMKNIIIKAVGANTWYTTTDTLAGNYQMFLDTGSYAVSAQMPIPFLWDTCSVVANLPMHGDTAYADLSVPALVECPFIAVELTIPLMLRCFDSQVYLNYCNYGTVAADSVVLFLELDTFLSIVNAAQPWALLDPNTTNLPCFSSGLASNAATWYLPVGALEINECAQVIVPVMVDCAAEPGQTHCITAHSCPDELCINSQNWSGANIEVEALCAGDSIHLSVQNTGSATSQPLGFVVVEDDVVLLQGEEDYQIGEAVEIVLPANGEYFRIQSEQEPGHPFPQPVAAWKVGCNDDPLPAADFINQFTTKTGHASEDTDCLPNVGAYDPNDKQGLPLGFGDDHLIERGVEIEYLVRFQNTGTAPAHNVVIRDTLSLSLDPGSVRVGAGSHPFTWTLMGEGVLVFRFEDINLPDSSANEPASHGFISFRIAQQPGLPLGTDIFNSAAIYFDFNPPVITNTTHHRLGEDFLEVVNSTGEKAELAQIVAYPNPAKESAWIAANGASTLLLFDTNGRLLRTEPSLKDGQFIVKNDGLPSGVYFMSLMDNKGGVLARGKLVFQ